MTDSPAIEWALSGNDWLYAAGKGCERQIDGAIKRRRPGYGSPEKRTNDGWFWNINGAAGELCVAQWLGLSWDGAFGRLGDSDVGNLVEVRTTPGHENPLRLHDDDKDDRVYILVTGIGPRWAIRGFILGKRGKNPEWFHDRPAPANRPTGRPAYWVPQDQLSVSFESLRARVNWHLETGRKTA